MHVRKLVFGLVSCLATAAVLYGATPPDAYQVAYQANLTPGLIDFSHVNITNVGNFGTSTTIGGHDANDSICANLYVFDPAQELIDCCTCLLTPNDLQTISASQLTAAGITGIPPSAITVGLLASQPVAGACDATAVTTASLVTGMRAWATVVHHNPTLTGYDLTEIPFTDSPLGAAELVKMTTYCAYIEADGSLSGICKSCASGAAGAEKQ